MKSFQEVYDKFPPSVRDRYDFTSAVYTGALRRITAVWCPAHGEFSQYAAQFRKGQGCPLCGAVQRAKMRRTPEADFFAGVSDRHGGRYDYTNSVFAGMNYPITVECPTHGSFTLLANKHFYGRQGCGICAAEAKRTRIVKYRHLSAAAKIENTAKDFFSRCNAAHEGRYTYPEQKYKGPKEKIRAVCQEHGEFTQAAWAHLSGKGCAKCGAADPKWEREVLAYVESLGFNPLRSAPVLAGKHVDVLVEAKRVGIELHGLYWHTESRLGRTYHKKKWEIACEKGLRLIQVFEDEWLLKRSVVESRIAAALDKLPRFNARQCAVEVLAPKCARDFLNSHHIQGPGSASIYYGLRLDERLLAVASFGKARGGAMAGAHLSGAWEVIRFASIGRVRGGFSRLLQRFLKDFCPKQVISYCDLRYGDGSLYSATGFTLHSVTEPDYWWVPPGKVVRVPRYATQKHKLPSHPVLGRFYEHHKTEADICMAAGWERIYGVGSQKWILNVDAPCPAW